MPLAAIFLAGALCLAPRDAPPDANPAPSETIDAMLAAFVPPCEDFAKGLRVRSRFGRRVPGKRERTPFADTYHLGEDVWLPAGTEVRSVGDGVVRYSDFSPTWTDGKGFTHWNLGNVIVIEHGKRKEGSSGDGADSPVLCSVYIHLGADRRVKRGDQVKRGQVIGTIGADRSEENGKYPAHLHFALHRGPYYQVSPAWKRELERNARDQGLPFGKDLTLRKGAITLKRRNATMVIVTHVESGEKCYLSLEAGSTSPGYKPKDIMGWVCGYGEKATLEDWIDPRRIGK